MKTLLVILASLPLVAASAEMSAIEKEKLVRDLRHLKMFESAYNSCVNIVEQMAPRLSESGKSDDFVLGAQQGFFSACYSLTVKYECRNINLSAKGDTLRIDEASYFVCEIDSNIYFKNRIGAK